MFQSASRKTPNKGTNSRRTEESSAKKPPSATRQQSLLSFFTKPGAPSSAANGANGNGRKRKLATPPVSSDPAGPSSPPAAHEETSTSRARGEQAAANHAPTSSPIRRKATKNVNYADDPSEDEGEDELPRGPKRRRTKPVVSDDDDDEFDLGGLEDDELPDPDDFIVPDDEDPEERPKKTPSKTKASKAKSTPSAASRFAFSPKSGNTAPVSAKTTPRAKAAAATTPKAAPASTQKGKREERYPWLVEVRDADKNPPDHPDYDPRTLFIPSWQWMESSPQAKDPSLHEKAPSSQEKRFSAFEQQYWEIKCKLYDTVVFFKKGKFYELYEDDARIGHQHFDLKLTDRVNMSMVGVPEASLDLWQAQFIAKGYKVARVDQRETALGKEMRERDAKGSKADKIIKRELACVLTGGTLVEESMLQDEMSTYCVAIKEDVTDEGPMFGVAFVDTAVGAFSLCEFADDADLTKFETLVAQIRPKELILEKGCISTKAMRILKNNTSLTTLWNKLKPEKEFWPAHDTLRELEIQNYFSKSDESGERQNWPPALKEAQSKELAMCSLGALMCYLQSLKMDKELISLGNFSWYDPVRKATSLVLDGKTLLNLEIFSNSYDGSAAGTLFSILNRCVTPFGKRMFKRWVCHPLADAKKINARLDAVDALNTNDAFQSTFVQRLSRLPDLERLISRVHAGSCRAIDFVRVLEGFEQIQETVEEIQQYVEDESLIGTQLNSMPDLKSALEPWATAFNRQQAKNTGALVPERGVEEDYDESQDAIVEIKKELNDLLKKYMTTLKSRDLKFTDMGKEIYLIEVPAKLAKSVPKNWDQMSGTQKVKRFYTPETRKLVRALQEAEETNNQIQKEVAGRFYSRFDEQYATWLGAVNTVANLDCLISLARASAALGDTSCRPTFVDEKRSVVSFEELRHPCMSDTNIRDFIPNDIQLGGESAKVTLLTGANAAGKSTVLRMSCIGVIMAQIGCYVPCKSATLTPVDRIMSRLGAQDNIFAAQSTFFVELSETKKILSEATDRSLVILDELGRGTSSYDGVAVAQAVLHHVATHIGCVGYFATHYHSLATEFAGHPEIAPKRMAIYVDDEDRKITFLYKLEDGTAEGSFGMHCAAMCGVNSKIIDRAEEAARNFEYTSKLKDSLEAARSGTYLPLGLQSDVAWLLKDDGEVSSEALETVMKYIAAL